VPVSSLLKSNRTVKRTAIHDLSLENRAQLEAQITDARSTALPLEHFLRLNTDLEQYAAAQPWRRYLFGFLGSMQNKVVLDVACGYSMTPVIMALAGATVHAVDVAPQTLAMVQRVAEAKGVGDRVQVHAGPAETLPYADEHFDLLFGGAALHHLQLERAGPELARVLKRGGRGAFQEPLGHNQLLEWARDHLPYRAKHPVKGTDLPLRIPDIDAFGRHFTTSSYRAFDLCFMATKLLHLHASSPAAKLLQRCDQALFHTAPYLQRYARFVVITVTK
jgi:SAM-dependent methyltransferase